MSIAIIVQVVNVANVELLPRLLPDEDEEEERAEGYHGDVHRMQPRAEADCPLVVDAERHEHAVGDERAVNPAEAVCEADDNPSHESEERAVEYPLSQFELYPDRKQQAMREHDESAYGRNETDDHAAHFPYPALSDEREHYPLPTLNVIFLPFHKP